VVKRYTYIYKNWRPALRFLKSLACWPPRKKKKKKEHIDKRKGKREKIKGGGRF
jgi:hypothetical protein